MTDDYDRAPRYYQFPNRVQVVDISEHLTSNGGQAVQYIARATRLDGNNKGEALQDLAKARRFIKREIRRIEALEAEPKPSDLPRGYTFTLGNVEMGDAAWDLILGEDWRHIGHVVEGDEETSPYGLAENWPDSDAAKLWRGEL